MLYLSINHLDNEIDNNYIVKMLMYNMKRELLNHLQEIGGIWRSSQLILMKYDYNDMPMVEQALIELSHDGVISCRENQYGLIIVTEYSYIPPPPPKLKVVK